MKVISLISISVFIVAVVAAILFFVYYPKEETKKEGFTNDENILAQKLYEFFMGKPYYIGYLNLLSSNNNSSVKMVSKVVYKDLESRAGGKILTVSDILGFF